MLLFFHCHKAAGTSVTKAAEASGMKLTQGHRNGNPLGDDGKIIDWNQLGKQQTLDVFEGFLKEGVDFVAVEFSFPQWTTLSEIPDLKTFTVLREPAARAFSNYRMDILNRHVPRNRVFGFDTYMNGASLFRSYNYYTRFFCRSDPNAQIAQDHFEFAKRKLNNFDRVSILENGSLGSNLKGLGFAEDAFSERKNVNSKKKKFHNFDSDIEGIDIKTFPGSPEFYAKNNYDYALYAYFLSLQIEADW